MQNMSNFASKRIKDVYVLLKENYRISRNIRMVWFFNNIHKDIGTLPHLSANGVESSEKQNEEIYVISWCSDEGSESIAIDDSNEPASYIVDPSTTIHFLSRGYRLVFALDLSPSAFQVSIGSCCTVAENLLANLAQCLCSLMKPLKVPHCDTTFSPDIYVTIFAQTLQTGLVDGRYKQEIVVQSCRLTPQSIITILTMVEQKIFHEFQVAKKQDHINDSSMKHDHSLVSMLRAGLLALQLLPSNTSAGLVVMTDGVTGVPDMAVLETMTNQLRSSTTSCSIIHLKASHAQTSYAYCPNAELLKFLASATYGTYINSEENKPIDDESGIDKYQKALLFWQFQWNDSSGTLDVRSWHAEVDLRYTPTQKNMMISPVLRKKQAERTLRVPLYAVLTVRLREGYMISSVAFKKNNSQLEVELIYPWNHSASLKYIASSSWPLQKGQTKVEVFIDGTYEFLSDVFMGASRPNSNRYRDAVFRRFSQFIKGLEPIDHMLTHLMSFASDSENLRPIQNHVPLFYLPPNSNQLVLSMQNENDSSKSAFAVYWKPILSLDTGIWQKWLHTHHIDLVLQHDMPLPKHLHTPSKSGRYHSIQCSSAMSQVTSVLREWCTFILLENHTYIKFVHKEDEERPSFFYIIRLSNKLPVVIIRLAFLIGTPGPYRNQVVMQLRDKILSLMLQSTKTNQNVVIRTLSGRARHFSAQKIPRPTPSMEQPCAVLTHKPLDRILIRYDHPPRNFMYAPVPSQKHSKNLSGHRGSRNVMGGEIASASMMLNPCKYLEYQRNVWSVTNRSLTPLPLPVVSQIATLLVKLRLSEGYHFTSTNSGVIAMMKEYPVMVEDSHGIQYCLAQYILFPPTAYTSHEKRYSSSPVASGDEDEENIESAGELFLSSETWVEPQFGNIMDEKHSKSFQRPDFARSTSYSTSSPVQLEPTASKDEKPIKKYKDISQMVSVKDSYLLKVVITLEHLRLMCTPNSSLSKNFPRSSETVSTNENGISSMYNSSSDRESFNPHHQKNSTDGSNICLHSGLFDLIALLDRCPRMKLVFLTLSQDINDDTDDSLKPNGFLFELFLSCLERNTHCEAQLSKSDCTAITAHMLKRENQTTDKNADGAPVLWKCFLKVLPKAKVMVVLLPASFGDLMNLTAILPPSTSDKLEFTEETQKPTDAENDENQADGELLVPKIVRDTTGVESNDPNVRSARLLRKRSMLRMSSIPSETSAHEMKDDQMQSAVLPVYVYECSTSAVTDLVVKDPINIQTPTDWLKLDTEQDHRIKSVDNEFTAETPRARFFRSLSYPVAKPQRLGSTDEVKSPDGSSSPRTPDKNSKIFYETIVDAYHRCFVRAVVSALRKHDGGRVAARDVQAATDAICIESVQEIDITQFLLITCPQVAAFRNQFILPDALNQADSDEVFSSRAIHLPVSQSEPIIRHSSSTSSNTDTVRLKPVAQQEKTSSDSTDQTSKGDKDPIFQTSVNVDSDGTKTGDNSVSTNRSAFKKPRRRQQNLPKSSSLVEKRKSDTDGDATEREVFSPIVVDAENRHLKVVKSAGTLQHGRSIIVGTPLKKLPVSSKLDWADLPDFPMNLFKESHLRHISGTDDQVQMNFANLLSKNFHPVHSFPDIYFLNPSDANSVGSQNGDPEEIQTSNDETDENVRELNVPGIKIPTSGDETFSCSELRDEDLLAAKSTVDNEVSDEFLRSIGNIKKTFGSSTESLASSTNVQFEDDLDEMDVPLFLCMTCSVWDKKTGNHGSALVQELPTKFESILSFLENPCDTISLSSLSITLDLTWMVLPTEVMAEDDYSLSENKFSSGLLPEDEDSPRHDFVLTKQRSHLLPDDQEPSDALSSLPKQSQNIICSTKDDIEWLLKDEVISALRTCEAIDSKTLEKVTEHIEKSCKKNCFMEEEFLKFVFGSGKSLTLFTTILEQNFNNFERYRMKTMGRFYYLTTERRFLPIQNWPNEEYYDAHFTPKEFERMVECEDLSNGAKNCSKEEPENLEHRSLKKTRSSNDSVRSPPARLSRLVKSCASLPYPTPEYLQSSISSISLPDKETGMSVDAIESDVQQTPDGTATKQFASSQSTPIKKTSSVLDMDNLDTPSPGINEDSPDVRACLKKSSRGYRSRHSLPNSITPTPNMGQNPDALNKSGKRKRPVKQRSMESNLNVLERLPFRQYSTNVTTRQSPKQSGGASPLVGKPSPNYSLGMIPLSRRRSANSATPVSQLAQYDGANATCEPTSSTPMDRLDNANGAGPSASSNPAYLMNISMMKEGIASPASLSDGEFQRYSTASYIESGYDGEESDLEGDDDYMPSLDGRNDLPSFWFIVDIKDDRVKIYFHRRNNSTTPKSDINEHKRVFSAVKENIVAACKSVNQKLLLLELHDTRMCNALLVEETEEDIWRDDQYSSFGVHDDHGDDNGALLADAMTTAPGQFECECVLEKIISLHPRLKMTVGMPGKSTVLAAVRHLMTNLMVMNRKNMFVYQLTDKSVYYCRMSEEPAPSSMKSNSRRSSQLIQNISEASASEPPDRRLSKDSNTGDFKSTGNLILRWHGIGRLSPQQEEELSKMNESVVRRLNDSVLEKITVILQRHSKLSAHDVLFIQPSVPSESLSSSPNLGVRHVLPNFTLSYGIPDEFISCISAVKYYLHQNLLQFMALPRYVDPTQLSTQFVAYKTKGIDDFFRKSQQHEGSIYLFHQSIEPGKAGYAIACIVLEISDLEGNVTPTHSQFKFPSLDQKNVDEVINLTEVTDYQEVVSRFQNSRSATPSMVVQTPVLPPQAVGNYVRFHLWLKGSVTVEELHTRLRNAVRHALFDSITELLVLKPPLCEFEPSGKSKDDVLPPLETQKSKRLHTRFSRKLSLPSHNFSSVTKRSEADQMTNLYSSTCPGKTKPHSCLTRVRSSPADGSRTDAMRSLFGSLNDPSSSIGRGIFTNLIIPKLEQNSKEDEARGTAGKSTTVVRRQSIGAHSADEGDLGALREVYQKFAQEWFSSMEKTSCPSIFQQNLNLPARSYLKNFVQDLQKIIQSALTDCRVKIFSCPQNGEKPHAASFETEQEINVPSRYTSYIIIARNFPLWRKAVGQSAYSESHSFTTALKFQPYDAAARPDQSPRPQEHRFITSSPYISRQQFIMISVEDGKMKVWGYNISNEIATNLQTKLKSCTNFHAARWRAQDCLTFQKLGLFRHCTFEVGYPTRSNEGKGTNRFTRDIRDVDMVLSNTETPTDIVDAKSQQRSSKSTRRPFFKEAYLTNMPVKPLTSSSYGDKDTVVQYSKQYLEMKANFKKRSEELQILQRVFSNWRDRLATSSHNALTKDVLQVLLRLARMVHHVTSPILVSSYLRRMMPKCRRPTSNADVNNDANSKETVTRRQKRHTSGSLRKSGEFSGKIVDESRSRSNSTRKGSRGSLQLNLKECMETPRFDVNELKKAISTQYVQYWQSLQFLIIKEEVRSRSDKSSKKTVHTNDMRHMNIRTTSETSSKNQGTPEKSGEVSYPLYLYRASSGGIVIVEIGFVGLNFSVKLHVIEASKLSHQLTVKQQMNVHFINEYEHLKDLTHVHSFMFDFHLRYMQMYIQERQTAIRPGYHLVSFLEDFDRFYKSLPECAINSLHHGDMQVDCSHVKPEELYDYLVGKQAPNLGFKTLKLVKGNDENTEHALVSSRLIFDKTHGSSCNVEEHESYDIGYVIWLDKTEQALLEQKTVKLKFFLLFTNRRHVFPRLDRREDRSQNIFTLRRASAHLTPRGNKEKSSADPNTQHQPKNIMSPLAQPEVSEKNVDAILMPSLDSPVAPRVKIENSENQPPRKDSDNSDPNSVSLVSPKPPEILTLNDSESLLRKTFQSQGRRRSMPNVGVVLSIKKQKPPSSLASQFWKEDEGKINVLADEEIDSAALSFVECEKNRLVDYLKHICASAEIQCYKNQLWSTVYNDKPVQNHPSTLPIKDFQHLLKHCQVVPLFKVSEKGAVLGDVKTMGIKWGISLQKHMRSTFSQISRYFTNPEETKRFLGVLNPKLYLMMFLLTVDTENEDIGMFVVVRDKIAELEKDNIDLSSNAIPSLIPLRGHVNDMIDFMCFHTWTTLFS